MSVKTRPEASPIVASNLTKRYGSWKALDDVSFEVSAGESLGMWGPNGAGKTTIMRCLLGIAKFEGTVRVGEFDPVRDGRRARQLIGFVPQDLPVSAMTVAETARFVRSLKQSPAGAEDEPLALLGIVDHLDKPVAALSGGMRQRLALALALIGGPRILLLDEPTANLDARGRAELLDLLLRLREQGLTMIFSSHQPDDVVAMADRVLLIESGKMHGLVPVQEFGRTSGATARVVVTLSNGHLRSALDTLANAGVVASGAGHVLTFDVPNQRKTELITLLVRNGVEIADLEMERGQWIEIS